MLVRTVFIFATNQCNHRCKHCYINFEGCWNPAELCNTVQVLSKEYQVVINGAEPLLEPEYLKAYQLAGQKYLYSNGLVFLKKENIKLIQTMKQYGINTLRISQHFDACYDLGAVDCKTIEDITTLLIKEGMDVHYNTTITTSNYNKVYEMCNKANALGVRRIKFFLLRKAGSAYSLDEKLFLNSEQIEEFYNEVSLVREMHSKDELLIRIDGDFSNQTAKFHCSFGSGMLVITPDKNIYGCTFGVKEGNEIGRLSEANQIVMSKSVKHDGTKCILT